MTGTAIRRMLGRSIFNPSMGKRFAVIVGDHISREIVTAGCYERPFIKFLTENAGRIFDAPESKAFIDVGANIGNHSIMLAHLFKSVVAIEPNELCVDAFKLSCKLNQIKNIDIKQCGLSSETGRLLLDIPPFNFANARVIESLAQAQHHPVEVEITTLDKATESITQPIGFLKIDTEGLEQKVLAGGGRMFAENDPVVAFEAHGMRNFTEIRQALRSHGYSHFYRLVQSRRLHSSRAANAIHFLLRPDHVRVQRIAEEPRWEEYQMALAFKKPCEFLETIGSD